MIFLRQHTIMKIIAALSVVSFLGVVRLMAAAGTFIFQGLPQDYFAWPRVIVTNNVDYNTNVSATATAPDFNLGYTLLSTNASFTVLAPINVDTTKTMAQTTVFMVTNSDASTFRIITPPANVHILGTWAVTNLTMITFFQYAQKFTNAISTPIW
jgi:hypothetical protein